MIHRPAAEGPAYRTGHARNALELEWEVSPGPNHGAITSSAVAVGSVFGLAIGISAAAAIVATIALVTVGDLVRRHARRERRVTGLRLDLDGLVVRETIGLACSRRGLAAGAIEQLHVEAGAPHRYRLCVWLAGECTLLAEVAALDQALYIERAVEEWLCIPDRLVGGEVTR